MRKQREPTEVGEILRRLRGIRVRTGVAKEIGISYSMLCKVESGIRVPSDELKKKLASYYGTSEDQIFYTQE